MLGRKQWGRDPRQESSMGPGTANRSEHHSWLRGGVLKGKGTREPLVSFHIDFMSICELEGSQGLCPVHLCAVQYLTYL